ncbi:DUF1192 domain-containing protein [Camelimonas abortus]|uniref:DUF1192 domain-containing protein n=1 Tax=Camelimonas abortus TaxID=1017184 RepID=A0ABV7LES6_9HYPH
MDEFPERPARETAAHQIGQDLSPLSVDELAARIALLRAEIVRLEQEMQRKAASRAAADSLFRR